MMTAEGRLSAEDIRYLKVAIALALGSDDIRYMSNTKDALIELYAKLERMYSAEADKDWRHLLQTKPEPTKIESAIDILSEILGSREEVLATLSEMLVADCEFTEKQRREIFEEIKRLHKGHGS